MTNKFGVLFCFSLCCQASSFSTSVSCMVESAVGAVTVSGPDQCNLTGQDGMTKPYAHVLDVGNQNLPTSFAPETFFDARFCLDLAAQVGELSDGIHVYGAHTGAQVDWSITASSAGPDRMGIIEGTVNYGTYLGDGNDYETSVAQVGTYRTPIFQGAFELGVPFTISMSGWAFAGADIINPAGGTALGAQIDFELFEADGVTPVDVFSVTSGSSASAPEPQSFALLLIGGCAIAFLLLTRRDR
jgi:hypothetical protein